MRNEWIMRKGQIPHSGYTWWVIGDFQEVKYGETRAMFCDGKLSKVFPSLKNRDKVRVKITRTEHKNSIPIKIEKRLDSCDVWVRRTGNWFEYFDTVLSSTSNWLNKLCSLTSIGEKRTIHVSFRSVKD